MANPKPQPTAIDLFAGAGGASQGLKEAGYKIIAAVEMAPDAAHSYVANHRGVPTIIGDIRTIDPMELRKKLGLKKGQLGLLKACPPCQGFSSLGSHDRRDPRNDLVLEVWHFIKEFKPKALLLENVPALKDDPRLKTLARRMGRLGYKSKAYLVDAADFGVPQHRRRMILLASRDTNSLPETLLQALPEEFDKSPMSVGDALKDLGRPGRGRDALHRGRNLKSLTNTRIRNIPRGGTRFDLPKRIRLKCHTRLDQRHATTSYGRMDWDSPAPTMTTRCTTPACGRFIHPRANRAITLREAALIQTFPKKYAFFGFYDEIERQIGNALPVKLSKALGLIVRNLT